MKFPFFRRSSGVKNLLVLFEVSQALAHTLELGELLNSIKKILTERLNIREFSLFFFAQSSKDVFELAAAQCPGDTAKFVGKKFEITNPEILKPILDKKIAPAPNLHTQILGGGEGNIGIPLVVAGDPIGILHVGRGKKESFTPA
ncbi:MAG: hypothetical protein Q7T11_06920, partial [Deltaproteobacteria bacterium]|nr:hypothetical protein [Deltaproteobacteria bacterium]